MPDLSPSLLQWLNITLPESPTSLTFATTHCTATTAAQSRQPRPERPKLKSSEAMQWQTPRQRVVV
eukprot:2726339-Prorocentrum_lima.AAC.1